MSLRGVAVVLLLFACAADLRAAAKQAYRPFSFVVLGHVRGNNDGELYPLLDQLLDQVRTHKPEMIFLTGDMIWGGLGKTAQRVEVITQDWERLDAALAKLNIPIYRVPGNHDLHDPITRDVYFARYGKLPQAFTYRGNRFLLLNSSYVPEGSDAPLKIHGQQAYLRGKQLDSEQIDFIRKELSRNSHYDNVFLFMHHLLWDNDERTVWWREVHPLIAGRTVRAVFAGDVGPRKFSHMKRDGIDYIQSSVADLPMDQLRRLWRSRMVAQQFDNYLYVTVNGRQVFFEVKTFGEISSGQFTPESWREMHRPEPPEAKTLQAHMWDYAWEVIGNPGSPRRQAFAFASLMLVCFLAGIAATVIWYRWKTH